MINLFNLTENEVTYFGLGRDNGLEDGIAKERERIIKLLEDPMTLNRWWGKPDQSLGLYGNLAQYVIALIKGEK